MSMLGSSSESSSSGESYNLSYPYLKSALAGSVSSGTSALSTLSNALSGGAGASSAYDAYKKSTGYQSQINSGVNAITSSQATKGLLNSGATAKAVQSSASNIAQQNYSSYLSQLASTAGLGMSAAGIIDNAGTVSSQSSSSKSSSGLGSLNSWLTGGLFQ